MSHIEDWWAQDVKYRQRKLELLPQTLICKKTQTFIAHYWKADFKHVLVRMKLMNNADKT